ncbi:hypothetical protein OBV_11010 [Oscillibacter valericigenes Sjm18-20]|nr:hypothetical protein OBV_11010 [Oscillibacter valericigenes Sjm18-20]
MSNNKTTFINILSLSQILHIGKPSVNIFLCRWYRFGTIHKIDIAIFLFPQENLPCL